MLVVAPLAGVLAALAADRLPDTLPRARLLWVFVPFVLVVSLFLSYHHDYLTFSDQRDFAPPLMTLILVVGLLLLKRKKPVNTFVVGCAVAFALVQVRPVALSFEDSLAKLAAVAIRENGLDKHPVLVDHPLIYYYYRRAGLTFPEGAGPLTHESLREATPGTIIVWDSHYSYRPALRTDQVELGYLASRPEEFPQVLPLIGRGDGEIGFLILQKVIPQTGSGMDAPQQP